MATKHSNPRSEVHAQISTFKKKRKILQDEYDYVTERGNAELAKIEAAIAFQRAVIAQKRGKPSDGMTVVIPSDFDATNNLVLRALQNTRTVGGHTTKYIMLVSGASAGTIETLAKQLLITRSRQNGHEILELSDYGRRYLKLRAACHRQARKAAR